MSKVVLRAVREDKLCKVTLEDTKSRIGIVGRGKETSYYCGNLEFKRGFRKSFM